MSVDLVSIPPGELVGGHPPVWPRATLAFCSFITSDLFTQQENLVLTHITVDDGLSQNTITPLIRITLHP